MPRFPLALLLLAAGTTAQAQLPAANPRDAFFREGKIPRLDIDVGPKGLQSLRDKPREYVEATIREEGGAVYARVGVRLRGTAGSFRGVDDKPGFTVNVDKFVDDQRFHGMEKFHLANSAQDGSFCNELLASEIYRAAGVPAARISHAVVALNGRKLGLFYFKEGYDKAFIQANFANTGGNFYDGGFLKDIDQPIERSAGKKDPAKEYADLKAVVALAREPDHARRFRKLEPLLDMDNFLLMCAIQAVTWDWDGYAMKPNNYRIYHDPKLNKLTFIPSGMDQLWGDVNGPILPGFNGLLARAILETPQGKERYLAKLREVMAKAFPADLVATLDAVQARLRPVLSSIDKGLEGNVTGQIKHLKNVIPQRTKSINDQLQKQAKK